MAPLFTGGPVETGVGRDREIGTLAEALDGIEVEPLSGDPLVCNAG